MNVAREAGCEWEGKREAASSIGAGPTSRFKSPAIHSHPSQRIS